MVDKSIDPEKLMKQVRSSGIAMIMEEAVKTVHEVGLRQIISEGEVDVGCDACGKLQYAFILARVEEYPDQLKEYLLKYKKKTEKKNWRPVEVKGQ